MRVVETIVTSAPPELVWRVLTDVEHWRDWNPNVLEIKPVGSARLGRGARYLVVQPKLRPAIYELTEYVPGQRFTWEQRLAGGALVADHCIASRHGATEVELSFASRGLLANMLARLFSRIVAHYVATEARSLKSYCETQSYQKAS